MDAGERTTVYQYFDANGHLLYVGVTDRGPQRAHEHSATKTWWWSASGCSMEHYETRDAALAREKELIQQFRPPFNRQHNPTPIPYRGGGIPTFHPVGSTHDEKARAWYALSPDERIRALCISCGERPSGRRGPSCDVCMAAKRAKKRKYAA